MSNQLQITGGAKVRNLEGVLTGTSGVVSSLGINVPDGIPQLDGSGKILVSQLPNSVMEYKGTWNVATNTPYLVDGVGNAGDVYIVTGAATGGTTHNFGAGPILFYNGDQAIYDGSLWQRASGSSGTVTSVAMTTPTGLSVTGSPITTSGTLALSLSSGYIIPTTSFLSGLVPYTGATASVDLGLNSLTANNAYFNNIVTINATGNQARALYLVTGTAGANYGSGTGVNLFSETTDNLTILFSTATTTKRAILNGAGLTAARTYTLPNNSGTIALTSDISYPVTSVFGRTGAVTAQSGDYTTTLVTEGTNLYFTNARAIASTLTGYISGAGTITSADSILSAIQKLNGNIIGLVTGVSSVFGRTGAVVAAIGDYTTTQVTEGTNLYFTNARARAAISETVTGLDYNNTTGVLSTTTGYGIPTTTSQTNWDTAYTNRITSASLPLSIAANAISIAQANTTTNGFLSSTDWNTFNNKQAAGNYITALTGEATASGPNSASVTLTNSAVIGKVLTGLNVTGGSVTATDSILTAFGKVQNQINGLIGGSIYQGVWNASTNTPTLTSSVGTKGYYYIVNVAGTTNLNGITDWQVGDWAIYDGSSWQKVDNTDAVSSVNGFTGAVNLTTSNISEGSNLYYTDARARGALSFTAGSGAYNSTTGVITIPTNTNQLTNGANFITLTSLSAGAGIYYDNTSGVISSTIVQYTDAMARAAISLTTTGTSGAATYNSTTGVLNIPNYSETTFGTVTSVGLSSTTSGVTIGSSPISTSGTITLAIATASGSQQGLLSSTDWTTFNNKQNALTNPVTGIGTTNTLPKFTGTSAIGNSNITDSGSLITLGSNSYVNGSLGIGTSTLTGYNLRINRNPTGATTTYGISFEGTVQSDVTNVFVANRTLIATLASAFTLSTLTHYSANQATIGAGSTLTSQYGFVVESNMIGATNNYGFQGKIAAAANNWNLYMNGTANNYLAGSLAIGTTGLAGTNLSLNKNITGGWLGSATYGANMYSAGAVQSDVTTQAHYFVTRPSTAATAFTLNSLISYTASVASIGAGSTVTNLSGFLVESTHIGGTNNYAFYGNLAAATNTWNIYMNGTADNYMAGSLGIGSTTLTGINFRIGKNITGATTSYNALLQSVVQSDVTVSAANYYSTLSTAASAFTLSFLYHFRADQGTIGAGSAVTAQAGFWASASIIGATNNYGFYGDITGGTGRWNLYMNGTASNYLNGVLTIGTVSPNASAKVQIDSTTQGFLPPRMTSAQRTAISTPATGLMVYQTDGTEGVYVYTSAGWKSLTMV